MDKKIAELIALMRYRIIAPALEKGIKQKDYFSRQAERTWDVPGHGEKQFTIWAFKSWLEDYRTGGFDALLPATRRDSGKFRKITSELEKVVIENSKQFGGCPVSVFYRWLDSQGIINPPSLSESALRRFISANHLLQISQPPAGRKKFEKEHINELWTSDFMHGPVIAHGKSKRKTYLCGIIDDHSRMVVGSGWFLAENTLALETVLKQAICRFGMPRAFYCDNGAAFSTDHLHLVCARLGIALIHSKPYDSPSRGKVERLWGTVRMKFLSLLEDSMPADIDALNEEFASWLDGDYHKVYHHGIEARPIDRWLADARKTPIRKVSREELDLAFYQSFIRKVKADCTIRLERKLWQVPAQYIGKKIEVRYPTGSPVEVYLFENGKPLLRLSPCRPNDNATLPAASIRFSGPKKENKK